MVEKNKADFSLNVLSKRKHAKLRWSVLIFVQLLIIVHIIVWLLGKHYGWFSGKTLTPVEPSEGVQFVAEGIVNVGTIFFTIALLSTLIFGRWFCGWACHIVLLQDWCYLILRKFGIRPKPFRARLLMWFPFALGLYMFVWPLFYRFVVVQLPFPNIQTDFVTEDFWSSFAPPLIAVPFLLVCGFATVYVLGAKGFCTYGCPYGGFFKPLDAVSPMHVRVNDNCQQCGKCTAACTSNVRVHEEVNLYKMVVDSGCMKIMDCVDACPNDALSIGFGPVAVGKRTKKRTYDLSIWEEVCVALLFLFSFFAFRGLYALIPMLMAVGVALVATWVLWKAWRVLRDQNASFQGKQLKFHGKISGKGVTFLLLALCVLLLTLHSATMQTFKLVGGYALARNNTQTAMRYYMLASPFGDGGYALASNPNIDVVVARHHISELHFHEAERLYRRVDLREGGSEESTQLLGTCLQFHRQFQPIDEFYVRRLEENPSWVLIWVDYVSWLKNSGLYTRAIEASTTSVQTQSLKSTIAPPTYDSRT